MAYPIVNGPYGLVPVNRIDGLPYSGAMRSVQIASGYASNIFNGDIVQIDTNGQCIVSAITNGLTPSVVGVFMGCSYTNPSTKQRIFSQYWPSGTVAADAMAVIIDDPMVLYKVAVCSAGTTIGTTGATRASIGANVTVLQTAGNTTTGKSNVSVLQGSEGTTATVLRVIDVVPETAIGTGLANAGNFTELLVKINNHQYVNTTGV